MCGLEETRSKQHTCYEDHFLRDNGSVYCDHDNRCYGDSLLHPLEWVQYQVYTPLTVGIYIYTHFITVECFEEKTFCWWIYGFITQKTEGK